MIEKVKKDEEEKQVELAHFESWAQRYCFDEVEFVPVFQKRGGTVRLVAIGSDLPPGIYDARDYPLFTLAHHGFSDKDKVMDLIDSLSKDHNH